MKTVLLICKRIKQQLIKIIMKTLNDLINNRSQHGDLFQHEGREIEFHGKTLNSFPHYKLFPTNEFGTASSKKKAIQYLKTGSIV